MNSIRGNSAVNAAVRILLQSGLTWLVVIGLVWSFTFFFFRRVTYKRSHKADLIVQYPVGFG